MNMSVNSKIVNETYLYHACGWCLKKLYLMQSQRYDSHSLLYTVQFCLGCFDVDLHSIDNEFITIKVPFNQNWEYFHQQNVFWDY